MATISLRLRLTRFFLRFIQLYLTLIFSFLILLPRAIGPKLFRLGANLLDSAVWPWSKKALRDLNVTAQEVQIAAVACTWFTPTVNQNRSKLMIYLHGGGFMLASTKTHGSLLAALANELSCKVIGIDYSLSPEQRYPTALNEILSVYSELLTTGYQAKDILIGGESAGGCLVLALLMRLRDEGNAMPSGAFLDSPVTDLSFRAESLSVNWLHECVLPVVGPFTSALYRRTFSHYAAGAEIDDPYVSPLAGSFKRLPPIHISYSEHEILRDDAKRLSSLAKADKVAVTDYPCAWAPHAPLALYQFSPEGHALFHEVCNFIRLHLALVNPRVDVVQCEKQ